MNVGVDFYPRVPSSSGPGSPGPGLVFTGGLGAVAGLLAPFPDDLVGIVPTWARSPQNTWAGISGRARVVAYNTKTHREADLPTSLKGFTDPKWKGRIGWPPSNGSFQAMLTAMRMMWGKGFTALIYYLHGGGPGILFLMASAGIPGTAKNRANAEKSLRFMPTRVAQQHFASQTHEFPMVDGMNIPRLLPSFGGINNLDVEMALLVARRHLPRDCPPSATWIPIRQRDTTL